MSTIVSLLIPLLATLIAPRAGAAKSAQPELSFANGTVSVKNITPGADVYLFGVTREAKGYYNSIVPRETILHDSAKSGQVDFTIGKSVPLRSIWFAVDLSSGSAVAGTPANYTNAHFIQLDSHHLRKDLAGDIAALSYEGALVEAIVVRPGGGVWGGTIGLRSRNDEGTEARHVVVSTANLEPRVGTTATAPPKLKNGDVVFLMDSYLANYSFAVLGGQP